MEAEGRGNKAISCRYLPLEQVRCSAHIENEEEKEIISSPFRLVAVGPCVPIHSGDEGVDGYCE